jgi:hypothetical protein
MLVVEGDKNPTDGLYEHEEYGSKKGLLHAYKKADEWKFIAEDEFEERKHELPEVSFAFKCPIREMVNVLNNPKIFANFDDLKLSDSA